MWSVCDLVSAFRLFHRWLFQTERERKREKERGLEKVGGAVITGQSDS